MQNKRLFELDTMIDQKEPQGGCKMKYRKKPVVIEAVQWVGGDECIQEIRLLDGGDRSRQISFVGIPPHEVAIETLEGTMKANFKDFIIKGVKGELYPCKSDIFEQTYEKVE